MIGMQSSLDRILSAIQTQNQAMAPSPVYNNGGRDSAMLSGQMHNMRNDMYNSSGSSEHMPRSGRSFPPLPGFAPPVNVQKSILQSKYIDFVFANLAAQIRHVRYRAKHGALFR